MREACPEVADRRALKGKCEEKVYVEDHVNDDQAVDNEPMRSVYGHSEEEGPYCDFEDRCAENVPNFTPVPRLCTFVRNTSVIGCSSLTLKAYFWASGVSAEACCPVPQCMPIRTKALYVVNNICVHQSAQACKFAFPSRSHV